MLSTSVLGFWVILVFLCVVRTYEKKESRQTHVSLHDVHTSGGPHNSHRAEKLSCIPLRSYLVKD